VVSESGSIMYLCVNNTVILFICVWYFSEASMYGYTWYNWSNTPARVLWCIWRYVWTYQV